MQQDNDLIHYIGVYTCRLCGKTYEHFNVDNEEHIPSCASECYINSAYGYIESIENCYIMNQKALTGLMSPFNIHECADGSLGLADFKGFKKIQKGIAIKEVTIKETYTLHLVTQHNQPYGSTRKCCERCGKAVIGFGRYEMYVESEVDYHPRTYEDENVIINCCDEL